MLKLTPKQAKKLGITTTPNGAKTTAREKALSRQQLLNNLFASHGLPLPEYEVRFHPTRKFRADLVLDRWLIIEIEGLAKGGGRHQRISGFLADMEKYNEMTVLGYRLLRFTNDQIFKNGSAFEVIKRALGPLVVEEEA